MQKRNKENKQRLSKDAQTENQKNTLTAMGGHQQGQGGLADVNAYDASLVEKLQLIDSLSEEEKKTVFSIVDAFAGKKKLREALNNVVSLAS